MVDKKEGGSSKPRSDVAAWVANTAGVMMSYPIDVIKTNVQAKGGTATSLFQDGRSRVLRFPFLVPGGMSIAKTLRFSIYERIEGNGWPQAFASGALTSFLVTPLESYKVHSQLGRKGDWNFQRQAFRGMIPTMLREGASTAMCFATRDLLGSTENHHHPLLRSFLISLPASVVSIPLDQWKTRVQGSGTGRLWEEWCRTIRTPWRGGGWRLAKAIPQNTITFYLYDLLLASL